MNSIAGGEQENCDDQPYTFNTNMFPEVETYFFVIQKGYDTSAIFKLLCFKDFEVNEEAFRRQIENPRSRRNEALDALAQSFVEDFIF